MKRLGFVLVLWLGLTTVIEAQIQRLDDLDGFSEDQVNLNFQGRYSLSEGRDPSRVFSAWGVTFAAGERGAPALSLFELRNLIVLNPLIPVLESRPLSGSSSGVPLVIDFRFPLRRCALYLTKEEDAPIASVTAFDGLGNRLGTIDDDGLSERGGIVQIVLETSSPEGISKLSIDYGESEHKEQITGLILDYLERPVFRTHLAHVADTRFGDRVLRTSISILNRSNTTARGEVVFVDGIGVAPQSQPPRVFPFELRRLRTLTLDTEALGVTPFSGFARVTSSSPVTATATFQIVDEIGRIEAQAGIAGDEAKTFWMAPVERTGFLGTVGPVPFEEEVESAFAIANLSNEENQVRLTLVTEPAGRRYDEELTLGPRGQQARFLSQVFDLDNNSFTGTLWLSASEPIVVTVLQTRQGLPLSSLPAGGTTP